MLAGQPADALYASIANHDLLAIGMNCATGPELMTDHIRTLHELSPFRISCYPNAGLPNAEGKYLETPESLAAQLERFIDNGWLNIVGGCCGTTPRTYPSHRADGRGQAAARDAQRARTAPIIPASSWWRPRRATGR